MAVVNLPFVQCCTENCFDELKEFVGVQTYNLLRDIGLVEYSSVYGGSLVCRLLAFKDEVDMPLGEFLDLIQRFLDLGIVIHCSEDGMTQLASIETFLKYADATGLSPQQPIPA